ncbi:hypothetical protein BT96DRAFT_912947 [Gymnopus androsaceus JB14]|uniref:F-box domain-containing protein n=1 Tax=Gymnopus androsaceus JB14 TaxID=1447944 RepID=A0A6A4IHU0_9AGAR|nr:hypothetical protein BT96DRAFT_912947 [Gymnopus androsaceus JB14]
MGSLPLLPVELLAQIFTLTTTLDSGTTLRSLLRVSHLFHNICIPLKFSCVTLTTRLDVKRFHQELRLLEHSNTPAHLWRILHVYISLTQSDTQADITERDTINQLFCILRTAAETLQSLTFIYHNHIFGTSVFGQLYRHSFPVLTELTIHGFYPFPSPMSPNELPVPDQANLSSESVSSCANASFMPMLERLHLSGNRNPYGLLQLSSLDECFPSLTHLRVSGLLMAGSFVEEVKSALEEHSSSHNDDDTKQSSISLARLPPILPSKLQSLVLQPGFMPLPMRPGVTGSSAKKDLLMMERLKEIDEVSKSRQGVCVTLKERSQDPEKICIDLDLHSDWLGRMNGAVGCW